MIDRLELAGKWRAAACLLLIAFFCLGCTATRPEHPLDNVPDLSSLRREALSRVNEERGKQGLAGLRMTGALNAAAQAHAEDMARRGYYNHRSPERQDVADRYEANGGGLWNIIAENIATCIACKPAAEQMRAFHAGWMRSPGHRRNILDPRVKSFGFGVASAQGRLYAVQTFVGERDEAPQTMPPPVPVTAGRSPAILFR